MGMKTPHDISNHLGTLDMLGTESQPLLTHGIEDTALNRLQTISNVR